MLEIGGSFFGAKNRQSAEADSGKGVTEPEGSRPIGPSGFPAGRRAWMISGAFSSSSCCTSDKAYVGLARGSWGLEDSSV